MGGRNKICEGGDKEIFKGSYKGQSVVICLCRTTERRHIKRVINEIDAFHALGSHPNIIAMVTHGTLHGKPYLAVESVGPIGYDMGKLKDQYWFAVGDPPPPGLMLHLYKQLALAIGHMHSKGIIHRDLKSENVLVTHNSEVKLIDMGITAKIGIVQSLKAPYLSPEICTGTEPQGEEVDCWGLGLILHQMYQ